MDDALLLVNTPRRSVASLMHFVQNGSAGDNPWRAIRDFALAKLKEEALMGPVTSFFGGVWPFMLFADDSANTKRLAASAQSICNLDNILDMVSTLNNGEGETDETEAIAREDALLKEAVDGIVANELDLFILDNVIHVKLNRLQRRLAFTVAERERRANETQELHHDLQTISQGVDNLLSIVRDQPTVTDAEETHVPNNGGATCIVS